MMYMHPTQVPQTDTNLMIVEQEGNSVDPDIEQEGDNESPEVPGNIVPDPKMVHPSNMHCGNFSRT